VSTACVSLRFFSLPSSDDRYANQAVLNRIILHRGWRQWPDVWHRADAHTASHVYQ